MSTLDQARETQLRNIETKTGKTLAQLRTELQGSGLGKHGDLRSFAMNTFGLGHGDANTLVHLALASDGQSAAQAGGLSGRGRCRRHLLRKEGAAAPDTRPADGVRRDVR